MPIFQEAKPVNSATNGFSMQCNIIHGEKYNSLSKRGHLPLVLETAFLKAHLDFVPVG